MHQRGNYQDFLKLGRLFLGNSLKINYLEGFFPKNLQLDPPKEYCKIVSVKDRVTNFIRP